MKRRFGVGAVVGLAAVAVARAALRRTRARQQAATANSPADVGFMLAIHAALRRDLERLRRASHTQPVTPNVVEGWQLFRRELEVHHRAEDEDLWPRLRSRLTNSHDRATLDAMYDEHRKIPDRLEDVAATLEAGDSAEAVEELGRVLVDHLDHEERDALPLVVAQLSGHEWHEFLMFERVKRPARERVEFLTWVLDDAPPQHADAVLRELPPPGRLVYRLILRRLYDRRSLWNSDGAARVEPRPATTPS
jgi:Hemerythrin HHE cation binding domain